MSEFERNLRDQLRGKEQQLDPGTLNQLQASRTKAVARASGLRLPRVLVPLGGMTLASLAVFFLVVSPLPVGKPKDSQALNKQEVKDLDFYYWLAETQDITDS